MACFHCNYGKYFKYADTCQAVSGPNKYKKLRANVEMVNDLKFSILYQLTYKYIPAAANLQLQSQKTLSLSWRGFGSKALFISYTRAMNANYIA